MVLNFVWIGLFVLAALTGLLKALGGNPAVFNEMVQASFTSARTAFEIALGLTGILTLWMGLMKVGEKAGAVNVLARLVSPLLIRIFPGLPPNHPAAGSMLLNFAANILGLDNAATPAGLKAMKELQTLNTDPDTASNSQIMFLVLNASGLTIIPVSIMAYRSSAGAANPADIFLPILVATFCSTLAGFLAVAFWQKLSLRDPVLLSFLACSSALVFGGVFWLSRLPRDLLTQMSTTVGNSLLFSIIIWFLLQALFKKVNAWDSFVEGAREGFGVAVQIIPFLVGILVAVAVFRASGAMDYLVQALWFCISWTGLPADTVHALPTALMKPLSGSGARGMMVDAMSTHGVDSFAGRLAATFQGSTDTTLYVLAVYFGSVGVRKTRYALPCALFSDAVGFIAAMIIAVIFFA